MFTHTPSTAPSPVHTPCPVGVGVVTDAWLLCSGDREELLAATDIVWSHQRQGQAAGAPPLSPLAGDITTYVQTR